MTSFSTIIVLDWPRLITPVKNCTPEILRKISGILFQNYSEKSQEIYSENSPKCESFLEKLLRNFNMKIWSILKIIHNYSGNITENPEIFLNYYGLISE